MKKLFVAVSLSAVVITSLSSCKKIIDKIFNGIDTRAPDMTVTIPAIPAFGVGFEAAAPPVVMPFNLDSIIKANSSGLFGIDDVKSVKVKSITVNLPDADNSNNLANFESSRVSLYSNTNTTPVNIAIINYPDAPATTITALQTDSPELLSYLKGNQITYQTYGKARRSTTKPLTFVVSVTMRVE